MKKIFCQVLACAVAFIPATFTFAQSNGLVLKYDFSNVSGSSVYDTSGSGVTATLKNDAAVENMGNYNVLNLGSGTGYLDMSSAAGAKLKAQDNYSISVYYRVDEDASISGNGYFLWAFSTSSACGSSTGKYSSYRVNAQRLATSTGGYSNETGGELGTVTSQGSWIHLVYTEEDSVGKVYINGNLAYTISNMPANSSNYGSSAINYCWLGRPQFSGDNYLQNTLVYDFRLYSRVLTEDEIDALANVSDVLDYQYERGTVGDNSSLLSAISSANSFISSAGTSYPEGAIHDLTDYVEYCNYVATDGFSQAVIDRVTSNLNDAVAAVESVSGFVFDETNVINSYDTDRGFKHPGMLHTQDDFDRIKQQLADGNETVTAAYNVLINSEYAQSTVATWPVATIVRGGGSGQNYINAARGATMAYQNALRWKIAGDAACGQHAIDLLMAWANGCSAVSGDTNMSLASGLYGYEFANAAELVRDYNDWENSEDFKKFKNWIMKVWYPACIDFLRRRHDTWLNTVGQGGYRPGHYWSNWGLCNTLAVMSFGVLCDDPFIYNQGLSYFKYDQVGTFVDPRTADPILNDGLTEYLGNLVVTTTESELETGAYGKIGQMQESGRDLGHATMALGLAVDIAHLGWNQGDDLFSYMDNRLAAGIEYVAMCNQGVSADSLPWTNYKYVDRGTAWHNGWLMTGPATGSQIRPYWGTVIGHYEGVKGVKMPYSELCLANLGIDGGGTGSTSGGYDHLGYSVLMNTRDSIASADEVPTLLTPKMQYNGETIEHNELGGLTNTFVTNTNTCLAKGGTVVLMPQLPSGATNTGNWLWNTGETTQNLTVSTDKSYVYRVTYTNENGVKSEQVFTIAVDGDSNPTLIAGNIYSGGNYLGDSIATVDFGKAVTLNAWATCGYGDELYWSNGKTGGSITLDAVTTDREVKAIHRNQGGALSEYTFKIKVRPLSDVEQDQSKAQIYYDITEAMSPYLSTAESYHWSNTGMAVNTGAGSAPYSNSEDEALIDFPFVEKYVASPSTLDDADIHQTIDDLPNGTYYIGGSFIAVQQAESSVDAEGVYFYAGDQQIALSTIDALPEVYSLKVEVTDHTLTYGMKTESATANWIAMDNLFLYFAGTREDYLAKATSKHPVRMVVKSARMESTSGWSDSPTVSYNTGEYYEKVFDISQTMKNAPVGRYALKAQAFQRPGGAAESYAAYDSASPYDSITSFIYAGSDSMAICNIASGAQSASFGGAESSVGSPTRYIPNNMQAASIYFASGLYENSLEFETSEVTDFNIGLKSGSYSTYYWTIFDNFRLYYYGDGSNDDADIDYYDITEAMSPYMSTAELNRYANNGMVINTSAGSAPYSNTNDGALIDFPFVERWVASPSVLANSSLEQTIDELPNGTYRISASFIANQQSNSSELVTGVTFHAQDQSVDIATGNGIPVKYSLVVDVTDRTLDFGLNVLNTTANWVAMDNITLEYVGTEDEYLANATEALPVRINLVNPRIESTDGWSASPTVNYYCAEYYQSTFDFNQTVSGLKAGKYILKAQAFQRPGAASAQLTSYLENPTDANISTYIYAEADEAKVKHAAADASTVSIGGNETSGGSPLYYMPNDMLSASLYFANGLYDNSVETTLEADGDMTIGIKGLTTASNYWSIFDNFRLYYCGPVSDEPVEIAMTDDVATYCPSVGVDFTELDAEIHAYVATAYSDGNILFERIYKVPAGTGVLLHGDAGTYEVPRLEESATVDTNLLVGVLYESSINAQTGSYNNYQLISSDDGYSFVCPSSSFAASEGTAYPQLPSSASSKAVLGVFANDGATGIAGMNVDTGRQVYYNLSGQRVAVPQKGSIYIIGGRKVLVR